MSATRIQPTGRESPLGDEEIIVSKTDLRGRITYANDVFLRVSAYTPKQILGQPHSIIRHPDMPRCIFKLLWDTLETRREIFAYVLNIASTGDHYWVFAHVTPTFDAGGAIIGYHSNRRKPEPEQIAKVAPLYASLLEIERGAADRKDGMRRSYEHLAETLRAQGVEYDRYVFSL